MRAYFLKTKEWWGNLKEREKKMLIFGAFFLGLFIFYEGIVSPFFHHLGALRERIKTNSALLVFMQSTDRAIQKTETQLKVQNQATTPLALISFLQKEMNREGLLKNLTQLKQANSDSVLLHFQEIEFDRFIDLLTSVIKAEKVLVTQLSVVAEGTPGIVNVDVVLRLGHAKE